MAEFKEVPYREYLKMRSQQSMPDAAIFTYKGRTFDAPKPTSNRAIVDAFYDGMVRAWSHDKTVIADIEKLTPEQLFYYMTETQGLVTLIGVGGVLTQVISKMSYHIPLDSKATSAIKAKFTSIPEKVQWKRSINATYDDVKSSELLGTKLKAWRNS
jgi:hypothetical protein